MLEFPGRAPAPIDRASDEGGRDPPNFGNDVGHNGMFGFLKRRRKPEPPLVGAIIRQVQLAVTISFIAQAELDFGPDWRQRMTIMSPAEIQTWLDKYFPDTPGWPVLRKLPPQDDEPGHKERQHG